MSTYVLLLICCAPAHILNNNKILLNEHKREWSLLLCYVYYCVYGVGFLRHHRCMRFNVKGDLIWSTLGVEVANHIYSDDAFFYETPRGQGPGGWGERASARINLHCPKRNGTHQLTHFHSKSPNSSQPVSSVTNLVANPLFFFNFSKKVQPKNADHQMAPAVPYTFAANSVHMYIVHTWDDEISAGGGQLSPTYVPPEDFFFFATV